MGEVAVTHSASVFSAGFRMIGVRQWSAGVGVASWLSVSWHALIRIIFYNNETLGTFMESVVFADSFVF